MPSTMKRFLHNRFVVLMEILGYVISISIIVWIIRSFFTDTEILYKNAGFLEPVRTAVTCDEECVLLNASVEAGQEVKAGDELFRVATEPSDQRRLLALQDLKNAEALLTEEPPPLNQLLNEPLATLSDNIGAIEKKSITAPVSGYVRYTNDVGIHQVLTPETPPAYIYDLNEATVLLVVPKKEAEPVKLEQVARIIASKDFPFALEGKVYSIEPVSEEEVALELRFTELPEGAHDFAYGILFGQPDIQLFPAVGAQIVTGHQSLFKKTFGRK